ncbi:MAG: hypothetical protein ACJAVV_003300 [Alphaproteobacteria bacterium]
MGFHNVRDRQQADLIVMGMKNGINKNTSQFSQTLHAKQ